MSTLFSDDVTCPHCRAVARRQIAIGIHGGRATAMRQAILDGSFQVFRCDGCQQLYRVEEAFTYIDPGRGHFFMCFAPRHEPRWKELEHEATRLYRENVELNAPPVAKELMGPMWIRTVFGIEALREKLVVSELGLDDRALEALKLELVKGLGAVLHPALRPRLVSGTAQELVIALWFDATRAEERPVPRALYDEVAARSYALIDELGQGPYVDLGRVMLGA